MIDNILITWYQCEGIGEHTALPAELNIYPNPANTETELSYVLPAGQSNAILKLYNEMGQLVNSNAIASYKGNVNEDVSMLPNGIYYYTISVDGLTQAVAKLIIIH